MAAASQPTRVLLKLSGEALTETGEFGLNGKTLSVLAKEIAAAAKQTEIAIVVGGGNIWRYVDHADAVIERATSDQMGMLATVMNAIALASAIEHAGVDCRVQSALQIPQVAEPYIRRRAIRHLEKGRVVIFAAGIGNPYFTTDSAAAQRALEIEAEVLLKGSKVDGIYSADPKQDPDATKFDQISYTDVLTKDLKVMDATAISLCRENALPIIVFNVLDHQQLADAVAGKPVGTKVTA
jgi:uridylate kinase